jgi:uncharacterized repeat protein (TIGR03803 family)
MKHLYTLPSFLIFCLLSTVTHAQGIYQLWGTTQVGGPDDMGILYSTKYDGTGQVIKKTFTYTNPGIATGRNRPVVYNNKLYALLSKGNSSISEGAIIVEYDPATNAYTRKADLLDIGFHGGSGSALTVYNGMLYGLAYDNNSPADAILFAFNPASNSLTLKHQFTNATGEYPAGDLTLFNNKLYGITMEGGINNEGVIYEYDPANNTYTKKRDLSEAVTGKFPRGTFSVYNSKLWAVTNSYQSDATKGAITSYDPSTNIFTRHAVLSSINGLTPTGEVAWYNNKAYGITNNGGSSDNGLVFEFNPANNSLLKKGELSHFSTGLNCGPFIVYNDLLYTQAASGGFDGEGTITAYNPATEQLDLKAFFDPATGAGSATALTQYNGKLYGFTRNGATYGRGCLFEYSINPILFTKKIILGGPEQLHPDGKLVYYNNKIYGITQEGGDHGIGGIYEYNPATGAYTIKVHMQNSEGQFYGHGGMIVYNNKFYGITPRGGATDAGVLFEYDPATNTYTKRYDFQYTTGSSPHGLLTEYGGKLYGTCSDGSTNGMGNIFQYDPVTYTYAQKVIFSNSSGNQPQGELLLLNNKLYGTTALGGANNNGTLFEYSPLANGLTKLADFDETTVGSSPIGKLVLYKNKFYGICANSSVGYLSGALFCYDLADGTLTKKLELSTYPTGRLPKAELVLSNNKLYGTTQLGGDYNFGGTLFEYDPETETHTQRIKFTGANGRWPDRNVLLPVPAPTAPGSPGSCANTSTVNIQAGNSNQWIPFTDNQGRAVAEINANGNILGNVTVRYFVNDGNVRKDSKGTFYLDRNLTFTVEHQPSSLVSIRLYILKSEYETLKATAGSGVTVPSDIAIFHNNDFCASEVDGKAVKIATTAVNWSNDYVYIAHVPSFSSFYFATNTALALPIHIESFTGKPEANGNLLTWKASCTNAVDFTLERSSNGIDFTPIGKVVATQQDCAHPFSFTDASYLPGKNYYRLMMHEQGNITYSKQVLIDRNNNNGLSIQVLPNPVTGSQAQLQINSGIKGTIAILITDMAGRNVISHKLPVVTGVQTIPLSVGNLPAGLYAVRYYDGQQWQSTRLIKQ